MPEWWESRKAHTNQEGSTELFSKNDRNMAVIQLRYNKNKFDAKLVFQIILVASEAIYVYV